MDRRSLTKRTAPGKPKFTLAQLEQAIMQYISREHAIGQPGEMTLKFRMDENRMFSDLHHGGRPGRLL